MQACGPTHLHALLDQFTAHGSHQQDGRPPFVAHPGRSADPIASAWSRSATCRRCQDRIDQIRQQIANGTYETLRTRHRPGAAPGRDRVRFMGMARTTRLNRPCPAAADNSSLSFSNAANALQTASSSLSKSRHHDHFDADELMTHLQGLISQRKVSWPTVYCTLRTGRGQPAEEDDPRGP